MIKFLIKCYHSIIDTINFNLQGFGFENFSDYIQSSFHFKTMSIIGMITVVGLGTVSSAIETYVGLSPLAYLGFTLLIAVEIITGILSSIKEGDKVRSRKLGRMVIKIGTYTLILGFLQTFRIELPVTSIIGVEINIYEWFYYVVLNMIIIQMLISLFENLDRLGMTETYLILKVMKKKFNKWFLEDDNELKI